MTRAEPCVRTLRRWARVGDAFDELIDAEEQRKRFRVEQEARVETSQPFTPIDVDAIEI